MIAYTIGSTQVVHLGRWSDPSDRG